MDVHSVVLYNNGAGGGRGRVSTTEDLGMEIVYDIPEGGSNQYPNVLSVWRISRTPMLNMCYSRPGNTSKGKHGKRKRTFCSEGRSLTIALIHDFTHDVHALTDNWVPVSRSPTNVPKKDVATDQLM